MKVSAGCAHCYAETLNHRWGHNNWGPPATTARRRTAPANWRQPLIWNKSAAGAETRPRVFCASMADVFEDHPQVAPWRADLFDLIAETPNLDWLLLTKRPQNVKPYLIDAGRGFRDLPPNVWIGTSVEDQATANERIPHLLAIPAQVRFLSMEPLLGPVDLRLSDAWLPSDCYELRERLHWVIVGGESGGSARPMHPDWVGSLCNQCEAAGVPFFFKQHGEWLEFGADAAPGSAPIDTTRTPRHTFPDGTLMFRVGKKRAGRLLDGRTWDELPT